MADSTDFRELLLAYRLDELTAEERELADRRMIMDDDYSEALKDAEYDLLDAYAAGELTGEHRDRVYRALVDPATFTDSPQAATSRQRDATELRRDLRIAAEGTGTRMRPRWRWALASAAAALFAAGLTVSLEYRAQQERTAQTASQAISAMQMAKSGDQAPGIANPQSEAQLASRGGTGASTKAHPALDAEVLTVVLPETTRGSSGLVIKLPPQTQLLRVEWPQSSELPPKEAKALRLEIADEEKVVATAPSSRRTDSGGLDSAVFEIPVKSLASGSYLFRVVGPAKSGPQQVFAEDSVTVMR